MTKPSFYRTLSLLALGLFLSPAHGVDMNEQALRALESGNAQRAESIWEDLAAEGDTEAMLNLGLIYESGAIGEERGDIAAYWYRMAAKQGSATAQYNLAGLYYRGDGVPKLATESVLWWKKAGENGMVDAQYNLGVLYAKGERIPQNFVLARMWLTMASQQGHRFDSIGRK